MTDKEFLEDYFNRYEKVLFQTDVTSELTATKELFQKIKNGRKKVMFAGNGASATIASHAALDFTKQAKVQGLCFNEDALITAFANDFGYENWVARAIEHYYQEGDAVVLISSSGSSKNIVNAAKTAKELGIKVITFSGFGPDNTLKSLGDINFWVESKAYNIIEHAHSIWLLAVVDMILGKAEYSVS
ncbi:MAG: SIS domain-containing protein [Balneola sp.]|nr:MAG: SIS domain-containing protein [Balneola sp.]